MLEGEYGFIFCEKCGKVFSEGVIDLVVNGYNSKKKMFLEASEIKDYCFLLYGKNILDCEYEEMNLYELNGEYDGKLMPVVYLSDKKVIIEKNVLYMSKDLSCYLLDEVLTRKIIFKSFEKGDEYCFVYKKKIEIFWDMEISLKNFNHLKLKK